MTTNRRTRSPLRPLVAVIGTLAVATGVGGVVAVQHTGTGSDPGLAAAGRATVPAASAPPNSGAPATGTPATGAPVTNIAVSDQVAPLKHVVPPDVLAVAAHSVDAATLARIAKIKGVRDTISADAGEITLQDRKVNALAVDPSTFRAWTTLATAQNEGIWSALAANRFVLSADTAQSMGLQAGQSYAVTGRQALQVPLGGSGPLGLPGIDMLVSRSVGGRLQLVPNLAIMVNAPGANIDALLKQVRKVLGTGSEVFDLRQSQAQAASSSGGKAVGYLQLYKQSAAKYCPGLSWTVLAAIGQIESDHGRNVGPSSAGALGPMQFMPATWKTYGVDGDGDGKADIMNPYDAIPAAAHYLCANGAAQGGHHLYTAIYQYNHADWYVQEVLALAKAYAREYS